MPVAHTGRDTQTEKVVKVQQQGSKCDEITASLDASVLRLYATIMLNSCVFKRV